MNRRSVLHAKTALSTMRHLYRALVLVLMGAGLAAMPTGALASTAPVTITIDATALVPQSWWQIPGITPLIWSSDVESSDAYRTSEMKPLTLAPGQYKFVSFTFDFPFIVTTEGALDFSPVLDQCVKGRGTQTLTVVCKRTYPHGGRPDY